ncbi:hypothetical protein MRX96_046557 [Rhipicephalus microplus]
MGDARIRGVRDGHSPTGCCVVRPLGESRKPREVTADPEPAVWQSATVSQSPKAEACCAPGSPRVTNRPRHAWWHSPALATQRAASRRRPLKTDSRCR